jgi:hypothetical protein
MTSLVPMLLLAATISADDSHEKANPLYKELREAGVPVSVKEKSPLPPPLMPDGVDARGQKAILMKLEENDDFRDELLRKSVVAPHVLKFRDVTPTDPVAPAYGMDLWFIAYGDLDTLAKKDVTTFFLAGRKGVKLQSLTAADLAKRGLKAKTENGLEQRYFHTISPVLDTIELSITSRTVLSRTADSLLLATTLDPAFAKDKEFPNQWEPIPPAGSPEGYDGNGMYLKVTRLVEPKGALFVESHRVSTEPKKWFGGANRLRSKLPILVQDEVRGFRRELSKGTLKD